MDLKYNTCNLSFEKQNTLRNLNFIFLSLVRDLTTQKISEGSFHLFLHRAPRLSQLFIPFSFTLKASTAAQVPPAFPARLAKLLAPGPHCPMCPAGTGCIFQIQQPVNASHAGRSCTPGDTRAPMRHPRSDPQLSVVSRGCSSITSSPQFAARAQQRSEDSGRAWCFLLLALDIRSQRSACFPQ